MLLLYKNTKYHSRLGATKHDFDMTVGIHPTIAETMTKLELGVTEDTGC